MSTTFTTARLGVATAVLAGAAVLTAAPSYAGPPPEDPAPDTSTGQPTDQRSKAQIEHDEAIAGSAGMAAHIKAKIEEMERQTERPAPQPGTGSSDSSDPSSVPVTVLLLLGSGLVAGAAGYTVYRFRHHGPVGAATA